MRFSKALQVLLLTACYLPVWCTAGDAPLVFEKALAAVTRGEAVVLLRHAEAPGTGDPAAFDLSRCNTQRNLSTEGRQQARRIGEQLRSLGLANARVLTSPWCRCRDTAALLGFDTPLHVVALGSFYQGRTDESEQTAATLALLARLQGAAILVSHQVNITALTQGAVYPDAGEAIVVDRSQPARVLARLGLP